MISIIIPCKNRLNHLAATYISTRKLDGDFEVIIVDYNCPMGTASHFENVFSNDRIIIVKAEVGQKEWNLSHARNLGYKQSKGDVLLFIDADTVLKPDFITSHPMKEGEFLTGTWLHASGCCMVHRANFEKVKGYNESINGWGSEDYNLYRRLTESGLQQTHFIEKLYKNMPHMDKIRNEYHEYKDIHKSNDENYHLMGKEFKSCIE